MMAPARRRSVLDSESALMRGQPGTMTLLCTAALSSQPVAALDFSPDRAGLFVCAAFDQTLRVGYVAGLR